MTNVDLSFLPNELISCASELIFLTSTNTRVFWSCTVKTWTVISKHKK